MIDDVHTFGKLSSKNRQMNKMLIKLNIKANVAGYQNHILDVLFVYIENKAPIIGPIINPIENAIPTNAIALPRVFKSDTSVMIAMLNEILPLLSPPTKRAKTNKKKFDDTAQRTYEHEIPNYDCQNQ